MQNIKYNKLMRLTYNIGQTRLQRIEIDRKIN